MDQAVSVTRTRGASVDTTSTGKEHFEVLDGLRGSAALLVVLYHIQGITVDFAQGKLLLPHAYLAVDLFFALSGFVIGYAYDDRWDRMSVGEFFKIRLIRLHPLVVLGVVLGLLSYLFDPFAGSKQHTTTAMLLQALVLALFLIPEKPLPNRWEDTHTLNGPSWTLLQEYVGNIGYALLLRRLPARWLLGIALLGAAGLLATGAVHGMLDGGWGWSNFWMAPIRLCFPFVIGLWLYRVRDRVPKVRLGWLTLTIMLVVVFSLPSIPNIGGVSWNGIYEALCIIFLFPAVVWLGAHSSAGRGMIWLCKFSGRISYPIYITHFPFMYMWMNFVAGHQSSGLARTAMALALVPFTIGLAWVAFRYFDLPIREWLKQRFLKGQLTSWQIALPE